MKMIKIGVLGLTSTSINKGCEALTYSFLEILKQYSEINFKVYFIDRLNITEVKKMKLRSRIKNEIKKFNDFDINVSHVFYRVLFNKVVFWPNISQLDMCFDFTQGDSFTDIYGDKRFNDWTLVKEAIISKKVPLILGSQTIGPFNKEINKERASRVINNCNEIFVRDIDSFDYVKEISNKIPILTTDVAFFLPYDDSEKKEEKRMGFNPSGLLWNGGYTSNNQFGLKLDYKEFCKKCIKIALDRGYEVHLIGHVIDKDLSIKDNDFVAIQELHSLYPETVVAPLFDTPMAAKTYISKMEAFCGARMHATIAAISSQVPVLPFSYSRKFKGLFNTLKYPYLIEGKENDIEEAVNMFIYFLDNNNIVRKNLKESEKIINNMKNEMLDAYKKIIFKYTI